MGRRVEPSRHACGNARAAARRGVTLLEVLAAMFVLTIGLLGMAALLPVGRFEVAEAQKLDRGAALGRAAFRDLQVRGFLRPEMWLNPVPGTSGTNLERFVVQPLGPGGLAQGTNQPWNNLYTPANTVRPPAAPIVLDPMGVFPANLPGQQVRGIGVADGQEPSAAHLNAIRTFPYGLLTFGAAAGTPEARAPKIARVTLREAPGLPSLMRRDLAERYFVSHDDAVFFIPERSGEKPIRVYQEITIGQAANNPTFRFPSFNVNRGVTRTQDLVVGVPAIQGDYSWFVTFSPNLTEMISLDELQENGGPGGLAPAVPSSEQRAAFMTPDPAAFRAQSGRGRTLRQFDASVVVVYKRPFEDLSAISATDTRRSERMAWFDFTGGNGGRLRLSQIKGLGDAEANLAVRPNEWICLIGSYNHPSIRDSGGLLPVWVLMWHRVISVADKVEELGNAGSGEYARNVTLVGPLIDQRRIAAVSPSGAAATADMIDADGDPRTGFSAFAVVIPGIVGVYQKTVSLDGASSYALP